MREAGWARWVFAGVGAALAAVVIAGIALAVRPLPALSLTTKAITPGQPAVPAIGWPKARESAVTVDGLSPVWSSGGQAPVPTASLAKMMTAYIVLRDHPLNGGEQGPLIPVNAKDVRDFRATVKEGGSNAKVAAGHSLTERQALEALMLPSADNVAWLLAAWDAGGNAAFAAKMNATAQSFGMDHTDYTDPSGLAGSTVSTARDQLILVRGVMRIPALAAIVAEPSAKIPVAGVIWNYNRRTGQNGIIGVKTGSDDPALGCWAFAIRREVGGVRRVVYGVVLGAPAPPSAPAAVAISDGVALADAMPGIVRRVTVLPAGSVVGQIRVPWRKTPVTVVTTRALSGSAVAGTRITLSGRPDLPRAFSSGDQVGQFSANGLLAPSATPVVTTAASGRPSLWWRIFR